MWSVTAPPYPINDAIGIGYLVNPTLGGGSGPNDLTLHDHQYIAPNVPDPSRAVITFQFSTPTEVDALDVVEHQNGITLLHGYAGNSLGTLTDVGAVYGTLGDLTGPNQMFDGEHNLFTFNNAIAGTYFQVVIEKTSLVDGYAFFRMFPETNANGFALDPSNPAYQHLAAGEQMTVTVDYGVSDGTTVTPASVSWTITGVEDPPVLTGTQASLAPGSEGTPYVVSASSLIQGFTDVDTAQLQVDGLVSSNGTVTANGNGTFTVTPTSDFNGPIILNYAVTDGTFFVGASETFTIAPQNNAPTVADGHESVSLGIIDEDSHPAGETVASLVTASFSDQADEVPGGSHADALVGVAIWSAPANPGAGVWQYSADGGAHWSTVPDTTSNATAILVATDDLIRFLPAGDYNGFAPTLDVRLVDSSAGAIVTGTTVNLDATGVGGTTPYSAASIGLHEAIDSVNDAPTTATSSISINSADAFSHYFQPSDFVFHDVDAGDSLQAIRITSLPTHGVLVFGEGFVSVGDVIPASELNQLFYQAPINASGPGYASFGFQVSDGTAFSNISTLTIDAGGNAAPVFTAGDTPDIVVANFASTDADPGANVSLNSGSADGVFLAGTAITTSGREHDNIVLGDLNGDGWLDVVVSNEGPPASESFTSGIGGASVSLNNGTGAGTFATGSIVDTGGTGHYGVALGDLNNDGVLDIVTTNAFDTVNLNLNLGNSTFATGVQVATGGTGQFAVAVGDINGDGLLDIVTADEGGSATTGINIVYNNGNGDFSSPVVVGTSQDAAQYGLALGDLNADGLMDIVVGNGFAGANVILQTAPGIFGPAHPVPVGSGGSFVDVVVLGDVNNDGRLDIVMNDEDRGATVALNNGDGTFAPGVLVNTGGTTHWSVALADVNGDGWLDLVTADETAGAWVSLNKQDGTFGQATLVDTGGDFSHFSVAVGNVDGGVSRITMSEDAGSGTTTQAFRDLNISDTHSVSYTFTSPGFPNGILDINLQDSQGTGFGQLSYHYQVDPAVVQHLGQGESLTDTYTITLTDSNGASTSKNLSIYIVGANDAPTTADNSVTLTSSQLYDFTAADFAFSDVDAGDTMHAIKITSPPAAGLFFNEQPLTAGQVISVDQIAGNLQFQFAPGFSGPASFGFEVSDGTAFSAEKTFTVSGDTTPPQVLSITASDPLATNATTVHYVVAFTEAVTGVDATQFSLSGTGIAGATVASVAQVPGSGGTEYTVAIDTGSTSGTITLELTGGGIHDLSANPLAGGAFLPHVDYATGDGPNNVAVSDLNGDGNLDLIIADYGSDAISVLRGTGNGTFLPQEMFATGLHPIQLAVGDFNSDGRPDLAVSNSGAGTASVLIGNGDGTFQSEVSYAAGARPSTVVVGDFNRDGRQDIAVVNQDSNNLSILLGNGDGTFQAQSVLSVGALPYGLAAKDLNGDGNLDLVTANVTSQNVSVLLGNGDGTFQSPIAFATGSSDPVAVAIDDLNADGKPDLVVTNQAGSTVSVLLANGDGTFQPQVSYGTGANPGDSISVADFNHDGKLDIAVANISSNTISLLHGNGDGSFQTQVVFATGERPIDVAAGDFNGDSRLDLAVTNGISDTVSVLLGTQPVAQGPSYLFTHVNDAPPQFVIAPADTLDIVVAGNAYAAIGVLNQGGSPLHFSTPFAAVDTGVPSVAVTLADVNGDGTLDAVTAQSSGPFGTSVSLGNGDGTFAAGVAVFTGDDNAGLGHVAVAVSDVNGDGRPDIVTADAYHKVHVNLGFGDGTFNGFVDTLTSSDAIRAVAVGDIDGDGKVDIVTTGTDGQTNVNFGSGDGTFGFGVNVSNDGHEHDSVVVADMNGDGRLDIVLADSLNGAVVLSNQGELTFSRIAVNSASGDAHKGIAVADLNNDGVLDIVIGNGAGPAAASVSLGTVTDPGIVSYGPFTPVDSGVSGGGGTVSVAVGDLNHDGAADIVTVDLSGNIGVALNDGSGHFAPTTILMTANATNGAGGLALGNIDPSTTRPTITEDTAQISRILNFSDPESADTHTVTSTFTGVGASHGTLTPAILADSNLSGDGSGGQVVYTYNLDTALVQGLQAGETLSDVFTLTLSDNHGGSTTQDITVVIQGANDGPILQYSGIGTSFIVNGSSAVSILDIPVGFTDADQGDTHTATLVLTSSSINYGSISESLLQALQAAGSGSIDDPATDDHTGVAGLSLTLGSSFLTDLETGQVVSTTYDFRVNDGHGGHGDLTFFATFYGAGGLNLATLPPERGFLVQDIATDSNGGMAIGQSVATVGDINNDGYADFIVGAPFTQTSVNGGGSAYVIFGNESNLGELLDGNRNFVDTRTLANFEGFALTGSETAGNAGWSVGGGLDVNGDGIADLIVGEPHAQTQDVGNAYVLFGSTSLPGGQTALANLGADQGVTIYGDRGVALNGDPALTNNGTQGFSVGFTKDINGDGIADIVIGAPDGHTGAAYVVFGGQNIGTFDAATGSNYIDLATLHPSEGFVVNGSYFTNTSAGDGAGYTVAGAADINGDGFNDIIIGTSDNFGDGVHSNAAYVVFGTSASFGTFNSTSGRNEIDVGSSSFDAAAGFVIQGAAAAVGSGYSVAGGGDFNGDGIADLVVGATGGGNSDFPQGAAYVLFGHTGGFGTIDAASGHNIVDLAALHPGDGFVIKGSVAGDLTGVAVAFAGDVNGDGLSDIVVGASNSNDYQGQVFVFYGNQHLPVGSSDSAGRYVVSADDIASNAHLGFRISGESSGDQTGLSVASAGDINGDGFDDLIVGAPGSDNGGGADSGRAAVVYGGNFNGVAQVGGPGGSYQFTFNGDDNVVGGAGNDTVTYYTYSDVNGQFHSTVGGADSIKTGAGDDTIVIGDTGFRLIDGGSGYDTLVLKDPLGDQLGAGINLDLTAISNLQIKGIEDIDMKAPGADTLTLSLADVFDLSQTVLQGGSPASSSHNLVVDGTNADTLNLIGTGWTDSGSQTSVNGTPHDVYNYVSAGQVLASVTVDHEVHVNR